MIEDFKKEKFMGTRAMIDPKSKTEFARLKERDPAALKRLERAIDKLGVSGAAELYGRHRVTIWKLRETATESMIRVIDEMNELRARILEAYAAHFCGDGFYPGPWVKWRAARLCAYEGLRDVDPCGRAARLLRHHAKLIRGSK